MKRRRTAANVQKQGGASNRNFDTPPEMKKLICLWKWDLHWFRTADHLRVEYLPWVLRPVCLPFLRHPSGFPSALPGLNVRTSTQQVHWCHRREVSLAGWYAPACSVHSIRPGWILLCKSSIRKTPSSSGRMRWTWCPSCCSWCGSRYLYHSYSLIPWRQ